MSRLLPVHLARIELELSKRLHGSRASGGSLLGGGVNQVALVSYLYRDDAGS
jgi:hypothetical protein